MSNKGKSPANVSDDSNSGTRPGASSDSVTTYDIFPKSLRVIKDPPKWDKKGCLVPPPENRKLIISIILPSGGMRDVELDWPSNGMTHIRANYMSYRVEERTNSGDTKPHYNLVPKLPLSNAIKEFNSKQVPDDFQRKGVTKEANVGLDEFAKAKAGLSWLKEKIRKVQENRPLDRDMPIEQMTQVGDQGSNMRFKGPTIENPVDTAAAKMEMEVGDAMKMVGDQMGFKNVSKIIKHAVAPLDQQWSDWTGNQLAKFLPSTAVVPVKTWIRAIAPSALMLGMLMVMKHTLKGIKIQPPDSGRRTIQGNSPSLPGPKVGGALGDIEALENRIRN